MIQSNRKENYDINQHIYHFSLILPLLYYFLAFGRFCSISMMQMLVITSSPLVSKNRNAAMHYPSQFWRKLAGDQTQRN